MLFLLALAVGLTLAELQPLEIGGIMLLGWLIVAALEWAAWRDEPHYGSGLPPPRLRRARSRGRAPRGSKPFLAAGDHAFVFFRHDEAGRGAGAGGGVS